jgi:hypothetical protein
MSTKSKERVKSSGEVFTPSKLVNEMLDRLPQEGFASKKETYLDNSCGNGQFLIEVLKRRLKHLPETEALGWCQSNAENIATFRPTFKKKIVKGLIDTEIQIEVPPKIGGIFGVDLMSDNVCDVIARIQLFLLTGLDYWYEGGTLPTLKHPGHSDNSDWYSLKNNYKNFKTRKYTTEHGFELFVRFSHFNNGGAGVFEYRHRTPEQVAENKTGDGRWKKCFNIVCCDALQYDYDFDAGEFTKQSNNNKMKSMADSLIQQ